jgi:uncharacterized protein (TIGR00251 family)
MNSERWWSSTDVGIELRVRTTPGARRSAVATVGPDHVRVRLAARAVEGQANDELVALVAGFCGIRKSAVSIRRGRRSRVKTVAIVGIDTPPQELADRATAE